MALENITSGAASTIADLDPNSPGGGEDILQGDDHIRNTKHAIQLTWPNLSETCSGVASEFAFAHKGGTVSGNAVILGSVDIQGTLSASGAMVAKSAVTMESTLSVSGATTLKGALSAEGAATMASTLSVSGAMVAKTTMQVQGSATVSGSLHAPGKIIAGQFQLSATGSAHVTSATLANTAGHAASASAWSGANKFVSTASPSSVDGTDGDIWFRY